MSGVIIFCDVRPSLRAISTFRLVLKQRMLRIRGAEQPAKEQRMHPGIRLEPYLSKLANSNRFNFTIPVWLE